MIDAELDREANDRYFGSATPVNYGDIGASTGSHRDPDPPEDAETDRYGIRIVYSDGLENDVQFEVTLPVARMVAASARENLAGSVLDPRVIIVDLDTGRIIDDPEEN